MFAPLKCATTRINGKSEETRPRRNAETGESASVRRSEDVAEWPALLARGARSRRRSVRAKAVERPSQSQAPRQTHASRPAAKDQSAHLRVAELVLAYAFDGHFAPRDGVLRFVDVGERATGRSVRSRRRSRTRPSCRAAQSCSAGPRTWACATWRCAPPRRLRRQGRSQNAGRTLLGALPRSDIGVSTRFQARRDLRGRWIGGAELAGLRPRSGFRRESGVGGVLRARRCGLMRRGGRGHRAGGRRRSRRAIARVLSLRRR